MKSQNISVEEAMKITHKSREFIIQAIENGSFPGSFTKTKNGEASQKQRTVPDVFIFHVTHSMSI